LRAAKDDPTGFVEHDVLMVIDEIQRVPELPQPIYTGQRTLPFGEKIRALPVDALWRLAP
jgi:hypothetical protein